MRRILPVVAAAVSRITVVMRADTVKCSKCGATKVSGGVCSGCGDES